MVLGLKVPRPPPGTAAGMIGTGNFGKVSVLRWMLSLVRCFCLLACVSACLQDKAPSWPLHAPQSSPDSSGLTLLVLCVPAALRSPAPAAGVCAVC